ncbi:MAG: MerR family transcriptional regulator [Pseudomonadota bacterium]
MDRAEKSADAFRTISEVSEILDVPQHVLRFWEGKFAQIKPMKRGGNRRYYRPEDLALLQTITHLLYTDGYTIKGVQKLLRVNGVAATVNAFVAEQGDSSSAPVEAVEAAAEPQDSAAVSPPAEAEPTMQRERQPLADITNAADVIAELKSIRAVLTA